MDAVQDELPIPAVPNKYGSQYQPIKDLTTHFESAQHDKGESISRSILLDTLYFLVLENKLFLPSFSFFLVYENDVFFSSFYSLYLKYEHKLL